MKRLFTIAVAVMTIVSTGCTTVRQVEVNPDRTNQSIFVSPREVSSGDYLTVTTKDGVATGLRVVSYTPTELVGEVGSGRERVTIRTENIKTMERREFDGGKSLAAVAGYILFSAAIAALTIRLILY